MKTTLLVSAVLLFSTASFAQTTVKNSDAVKDKTSIQSNKSGSGVNNSGSASSTTSIHSSDINNTRDKSQSEIKKEKKAIAAEKHEAATEAKAKGQESKKIASQDATISASAHSNAGVNASGKDNNLSSNTSLNNSETISSARIKNKGKQIKNDEKAEIKTQANGAVENSNQVKTSVNKTAVKTGNKVNTTSSAAVHAGAASSHSIHTRPVSIKTGTMVKTNAGVKIR